MSDNEKDQAVERDEEVLRMLQEGHPQAAEKLLEVFGDRVYGLSLRILSSEQDAQEAVQETFLTVWNKWQTFEQKSRFSSWIYRIAANQALMNLRKRKKRQHDISYEQMNEAGAPDPTQQLHENLSQRTVQSSRLPDDELQRHDLRVLIKRAVDSLDEMYRTAYVLKDLEGLTLKEIAEIMEISEAAAKSRVHRARLELRRKLTPYLDRS